MKLFLRNPGIVILIVLVLTACKKENLAKGFTGTYKGEATKREFPDVGNLQVYPECKIAISEVSRKKIKLTITTDPTNPADQIIIETDVIDYTHFGHTISVPRQFSRHYKGTLQSLQLQYEEGENGPSGRFYEFKFQGLRD